MYFREKYISNFSPLTDQKIPQTLKCFGQNCYLANDYLKLIRPEKSYRIIKISYCSPLD